MREEDKTYQLIEEYLNKNLRGAELSAFEKELSENPGLQQKVKLQKLANELVIENRLLQIKNILHQQKPTGGKSPWKYLAGGIVVVLLLTGIVFLRNNSQLEEKQSQETVIEFKKTESEVLSEKAERQQPLTKKSPLSPSEKKSFLPAPENSDSKVVNEEPGLFSDSNAASLPVKKEKIEENKSEEQLPIHAIPVDPCTSIHITANIAAHAACAGEEDGSILITGIKGGNAPYKMYVFNKNNELSAALRLSAGTYSVEIKDSKGCGKKVENIIVAKKPCSKDYSFNPFIGELWNIPTGSLSGKLVVYNDSGNVYFEKDIAAGAEEQWSGESKSGEITTGYFIFVLKYKDGTQTQGSVTIVR